MRKLLFFAIGFALLAAKSALAADLVPPPVYQAPPPPIPVYTWTGCYLGGTVGTGWSSWTYTNPTDNPTVPGVRGDILANDVVAGGQVGCDYQIGDFVLGVQGMGDWTQINGRFFDAVTNRFNESAHINWFATATGRIGYAMTPATLFYVKGGAAWVRNRYEDIQVAGTCGFCVNGLNTVDASPSVTQLGWTAGIGVEYMFAPNWSVFVEYNYLNFGSSNVNFIFPPGSVPSNNTFSISQHIQTIVVGLNLRFNFGGAPVAARY